MEYVKVAVGDLKHDPKNARKHDTKNLDSIKGSLTEFGQMKPIIATRDNVVIAGNGTLEAARALGWKEIDVKYTDLTPEKAKAYALADNRTSELASWDMDILRESLVDLSKIGFDLAHIGFDLNDQKLFMNPVVKGGKGDPDAAPDVPKAPASKPGDVWLLGPHRLHCGDSTKQEDVERLMAGKQVDLAWTDPPYNVNYESADGKSIMNDSMDDVKFQTFLTDAFLCMFAIMKQGASYYIAHADSEGFNFRAAVKNCKELVKQCLIWKKSSLVMGRQDYQWMHEPILYGWKAGASHHWYSDRKQTTILEFDKPRENKVHPTMKPIALIEYMLNNSSKPGDFVYDPFGGSGSTLIACQKSGRVCFTQELDPRYVDVIAKRFYEYTGVEPTVERRDGTKSSWLALTKS